MFHCKKCDNLIDQRRSTKGVVCPVCGAKLGKRAETNRAKLKAMAWKSFSDYIRLRDALKTTGTTEECICYTCGKRYPLRLIQAGHLVDGRHYADLFDEEFVRGQCQQCNVFKHGAQGVFLLKILEEKAQQSKFGNVPLEEIETMLKKFQRKRPVVFSDEELFEVYKEYSKKAEDLRKF